VSPDRTFLVTSSSRTLTTVEKMPPGDGRFDSALLFEIARQQSRQFAAFDMNAAAGEAGTVVSAVMLGAVAASGVLPFARERYEAVVRASGRGAEASLAGFARGWEAMHGAAPAGLVATAGGAPPEPVDVPPKPVDVPPAIRDFPMATQDFVGAGYARLVEFQDRAYADLFLRRLAGVLAAERRSDPRAANGFALTRETARFLALWMAFDDIVRVADLKCRASRFARVRREVAAGEGDVVRIVDYFKPGVTELASLLPPLLARRLAAWDQRRIARGRDPWSVAVSLATDSVSGLLALRTLAGLRWLRRRGARFAEEQALIERWLGAVVAAAGEDWRLAHEIALCGRLIKGYGATNERGKATLVYLLDPVAGIGRRRRPRNARAPCATRARRRWRTRAARPSTRRSPGMARRRVRRECSRSGGRSARSPVARSRPAAHHDAAAHDPVHRRIRRLRSGADRLLSEFPALDRLRRAAFLRGGRRSLVVRNGGEIRHHRDAAGRGVGALPAPGDLRRGDLRRDLGRRMACKELRDEARRPAGRRRAGRGAGDARVRAAPSRRPEAHRRRPAAGGHSPDAWLTAAPAAMATARAGLWENSI
jgi:indolepyruvate ferredoxin oxidoreductase beta subunit